MLYRERFNLSERAMALEPAEAFMYWLEVEKLRAKYGKHPES